ncbi:MAG: sel1 repeat family protein [Gammaproteobacteria bacterium]|jgi:TPR repeat protein|nr:sel1 repeat family protein [Gammaproteobacteria bacterium]
MMKPFMSLFFIVGLVASPVADSNSKSVTLTEQMAIHSQGVDSELGRGAPQDLAKAARWYRRAAELGYADAQNDLAKLYEDGRGVPQDNVQAYVWYSLAADHGNSRAVHDRKRLLQRMNRAELTQAQALLRELKPTTKLK